MKRGVGYFLLVLICLFYWALDSVWSYVSFEENLKYLIFKTPSSYADTVLLTVPPYQVVSRLMIEFLFIVLGVTTVEFMRKRQQHQNKQIESYSAFLTVLNSIDVVIYARDIKTGEVLFKNRYLNEKFDETVLANKNNIYKKKCLPEDLIDADGNFKEVVITEFQHPKSGSWYLIYDSAIKWFDSRIVHLQIASNITLVKSLQENQLKADEYLQQAQKMDSIGNLAGGIAHDFNNLLSPIIGMSELLLNDLPKNSEIYEKIKMIFDAGTRGKDLVKQILYVSHKSETEKKPVCMNNIIRDSIKLSKSTLPASIRFTTEIQHDCGIIMGDPSQVHQIIMNLITNAYHAVDINNGQINIQLEEVHVFNDEITPKLNDGSYALLKISYN